MGTITKALEMLNFFSRSRESIGLGEFVRLSGRDKATVHRHLVELASNGFLEQDADTRSYRLGPAILRLASVREATNPLRETVRPIVTQLSEATGELSHFSMLQGEVLSPVFHADPLAHRTQIHFDEAELLPLHATSSGLAVLAFSPAALRKKIQSSRLKTYTSDSVVDPEALTQMINKVRATGLSSLAKTFDDEVVSQAAPVFDNTGTAIGAISVAMPASRASAEKQGAISTPLIEAATAITRSLGGVMPESRPEQAKSEVSV